MATATPDWLPDWGVRRYPGSDDAMLQYGTPGQLVPGLLREAGGVPPCSTLLVLSCLFQYNFEAPACSAPLSVFLASCQGSYKHQGSD
jgi:hypothetical protein